MDVKFDSLISVSAGKQDIWSPSGSGIFGLWSQADQDNSYLVQEVACGIW